MDSLSMTKSSDDIIPEILKLYDMTDCPMILSNDQPMYTPEHGYTNVESSCINFQETKAHQLLALLNKAKECSIECFMQLHSHLSVLLEGTGFKMGFERAFATLFGQDVENFTDTMILNLDQLQQQLDQREFSNAGSMAALCVINKQFQTFIDSTPLIMTTTMI